MLATKKSYMTFVQADTALVAAFGGKTHIVDSRPVTITTFPLLILTDENQSDMEFVDNKPRMSRFTVKADVYTKDDSAYPTSTTLGTNVARVFGDQFYTCTANGETPDDTVGVRHRVMRFSRELLPTEI